MIGGDLRRKRVEAAIAGKLLCSRTGMDRSRLSHIERGYIEPSQLEIAKIEKALDEPILAKQQIAELAIRVGWPVSAL